MRRAPIGPQPTTEQLETLALVRNGADVFGQAEAQRLRDLRKGFPHLVRITSPHGHYPRTTEQPYFRAVATFEGWKAAERAGVEV